MRLRITSTMEKRLRDLKDAKASRLRGGVMLVPPIASLDDWEQEARKSQDRLVADARDGPPLPQISPTARIDPHAENERLYRENQQHMKDGLREYRDAKSEEVRRKTVIR